MPEPFPLDLAARGYAYVERPNPELVRLTREHVLDKLPTPLLLDVGSGAGANARAAASAGSRLSDGRHRAECPRRRARARRL